MAEHPCMPFWTDAYLGDTRHLKTLEHGAYLLLLFTAWRSPSGDLPDDDKILSRYTGLTLDKWRKIRPILEPFYTIEDGVWKQGRLLDERKASFEFRKSQSKKAKDRHLKNKQTRSAAASNGHDFGSAYPSPTPTPTPKASTIFLKLDTREREQFKKLCPSLNDDDFEKSLTEIDAIFLTNSKNWEMRLIGWLKEAEARAKKSKPKRMNHKQAAALMDELTGRKPDETV